MINRRSFIKGLIGSSIGFCHISVFADAENIKDIADDSIVIEGKRYVAAPIYTIEEARAAFLSAMAEWPYVRDAINNVVEKIHIMNSIDEDRMGAEVERLSDIEITALYAEWFKRHGIISKNSKLLAWTKDGELIGPPYGFYDSVKGNKVSTRDNNNQNVLIGKEATGGSLWESRIIKGNNVWISKESSGEYIVIIDAINYYGAPTYTPEKALSAFSATLADLPHLIKKIEKIRNTISQLKNFGGARMQSEIELLNCKISHLTYEFKKQHGIVSIFSIDDNGDPKFNLAAWTENGMVTGPVLKEGFYF